jgi:hypothetical protein
MPLILLIVTLPHTVRQFYASFCFSGETRRECAQKSWLSKSPQGKSLSPQVLFRAVTLGSFDFSFLYALHAAQSMPGRPIILVTHGLPPS